MKIRALPTLIAMSLFCATSVNAGEPTMTREEGLARISDPAALEILKFVPAPPPPEAMPRQPSPEELAAVLNIPRWKSFTELLLKTTDIRRKIVQANMSLPIPDTDPRDVQILLFYGIYKPWQDEMVCKIRSLEDEYPGWVEVRPYFLPGSLMDLEKVDPEDYPCFNQTEAQFDMNGAVARFFQIPSFPIAVIRHQGQMRITEWRDVQPVVAQIAKYYE